MNLNWDKLVLPSRTITTLDAHAAGEPLRIVTGGLPEIKGETILERRRYMRENLDYVRKLLMWEPRGHYDMYGAILTPPVTPTADFGVLFLHNEGYSTMCGHGVIALVTVLLETGAFPAKGRQTPVNLDTPAGLVRATAHLDEMGRVERVSFLNVPAFLYARDIALNTFQHGNLTLDIAFGGAFYAILPASSVGLKVVPEQTRALVTAATAIKQAVNAKIAIQHPFEPDLSFLYGVIFTDKAENPAHHSRNVCVFASAEVDRSPTGTGVSARLALHYAKGELKIGEPIVVESILGANSFFGGRVSEITQVGDFGAVVPEVSGTAFITGRHSFSLDPRDKLGQGFLVN
jgi:proline racemase